MFRKWFYGMGGAFLRSPEKGYMKKFENQPNHAGFKKYVHGREMPCTFGKSVVEKGRYEYLVVDNQLSDPSAAAQVCQGLYQFIEQFGIATIGQDGRVEPSNFASFDVAFVGASFASQQEASYELYSLLVNIHTYDESQGYGWAPGVSNDPHNTNFQMSVGGHAWFLPLLWPGAYAPSRRAPHVYLPWQSNNLFAALKKAGKYEAAQNLVRANETAVHGFVPGLLGQLGENLEILSYLLPHEHEAQLVWDALKKVGGEYPFGKPVEGGDSHD